MEQRSQLLHPHPLRLFDRPQFISLAEAIAPCEQTAIDLTFLSETIAFTVTFAMGDRCIVG